MRAVLFCLVLSANALPEAHLPGGNRDRDLSVPDDAKNRLFGLASDEKPSVALAHGGAWGPGEGAVLRLHTLSSARSFGRGLS